MIAQAPGRSERDPWRTIWRIATGDSFTAAVLLVVAAGLITAAWLPQMPEGDLTAHAQWLSRTQARFGDATTTLQRLGLFSITSSIGFRAALALLAGCLSLRLVECGDRLHQNREMSEPQEEWQEFADVHLLETVEQLRRQHYRILNASSIFQIDRWPWADAFPLLAHAGALLLLAGLFLTCLWGWQFEGLIVQADEKVTLPGTGKWVALDGDARRETHSPGVSVFFEEHGPGVRASAADAAGRPLLLQHTPEADPAAQLTVAMTEDQYFAIPEAQLVVRLTVQPDQTTDIHTPVLVQVYRSPSGRLTSETVMEGDVELAVEEVTLKLASLPYARLTVSFNPGFWPTVAGLALSAAGILGSLVWPQRRFWLREESEQQIAVIGDLLPALTRGEGA